MATKTKRAVAPRQPRRAGRPVGSTKAPTTIRLDTDVLAALQAMGKGWQTQVNAVLRNWVLGGDLGGQSSPMP